MNYLVEAKKLAKVARPVEKPETEDWQRAETELKVHFPGDFKELVSAIGTGSFGVGLNLRNPRASSEYVRLSHEALLSYHAMSTSAASDSGIILYPDKGGAISIGGMDRQDFLFLPGSDGKELENLLWWNIDAENVVTLRPSVPQFLLDLYHGRVDSEWSNDLREYFWRGGTVPFFTPWSNADS